MGRHQIGQVESLVEWQVSKCSNQWRMETSVWAGFAWGFWGSSTLTHLLMNTNDHLWGSDLTVLLKGKASEAREERTMCQRHTVSKPFIENSCPYLSVSQTWRLKHYLCIWTGTFQDNTLKMGEDISMSLQVGMSKIALLHPGISKGHRVEWTNTGDDGEDKNTREKKVPPTKKLIFYMSW